ncbi:ParB/Srx family N-terminal domain-containing protein [Roseibium album]|uniref:ParB/Srx family N-terminal domain-containing protein n=1 Tax=Roseibium album TaxID=311410 RepID=UPI0024934D5D|nr:ParB/Srx family N-terminal domain-containing protein [Roseibium album]
MHILKSLRSTNERGGKAWQTENQGLHGKRIKLDPETVHQLPSLFQQRSIKDRAITSRRHVEALGKIIEDNRESLTGGLDPITVWNSGARYYVIEGHHRARAFQHKDWKKSLMEFRLFVGSLDDALLQTLRVNSKDKLSMSKSEKTDAAWRLLPTTLVAFKPENTRRQCEWRTSANVFARTAGISTRLIEQMRSAFRLWLTLSNMAEREQHEALAFQLMEDCQNRSWSDVNRSYLQARDVMAGLDKDTSVYDAEAELEEYQRRVDRLAGELSDVLKPLLVNDHQIVFDAIMQLDPDTDTHFKEFMGWNESDNDQLRAEEKLERLQKVRAEREALDLETELTATKFEARALAQAAGFKDDATLEALAVQAHNYVLEQRRAGLEEQLEDLREFDFEDEY